MDFQALVYKGSSYTDSGLQLCQFVLDRLQMSNDIRKPVCSDVTPDEPASTDTGAS